MTASTTGNDQGSFENREEDFFRTLYDKFESDLGLEVSRETFDEYIGQNSWMMADEQKKYISWLNLEPEGRILDVACGSGGPSINLAVLTNCNLIGIDVQEGGINFGNKLAFTMGLSNRVRFELHDANDPLPYASETFDAVICIDSICHFHHRDQVLAEWKRVLKPGGRLLYTDPFVVTGILSNEEIKARSAHAYCLLFPPGENERLIKAAGFKLLIQEDATENAQKVSTRLFAAREAREEALRQIEGETQFITLQNILSTNALLTQEGRLARFVYLAKKPK